MIENIDIGGPSMIRSAAKNYKDVTVVVDVNDYSMIIEKLKNDRALIVYKIRSSSAVDFRHVFETVVEEISVL